MGKKQTFHGWTVEQVAGTDGPTLRLAKGTTQHLVIEGEPGMAHDVLLEYAVVRALEDDVRVKDTAAARHRLARQIEHARERQRLRAINPRLAERLGPIAEED